MLTHILYQIKRLITIRVNQDKNFTEVLKAKKAKVLKRNATNFQHGRFSRSFERFFLIQYICKYTQPSKL